VKQYQNHPLEQKSLREYIEQDTSIQIQSLDEERIVFDIKGIDASIANALRRIMLAEVKSIFFSF